MLREEYSRRVHQGTEPYPTHFSVARIFESVFFKTRVFSRQVITHNVSTSCAFVEYDCSRVHRRYSGLDGITISFFFTNRSSGNIGFSLRSRFHGIFIIWSFVMRCFPLTIAPQLGRFKCVRLTPTFRKLDSRYGRFCVRVMPRKSEVWSWSVFSSDSSIRIEIQRQLVLFSYHSLMDSNSIYTDWTSVVILHVSDEGLYWLSSGRLFVVFDWAVGSTA